MRLQQRSPRNQSRSFRPTLEGLEERITPVVISNGIPSGTVGEFKVDVDTAGDQSVGSGSEYTFAPAGPHPANPTIYTKDTIYAYNTFIDTGTGGGKQLSSTTIDQTATKVGNTVVSKGHFTGSAGQTINWISTDSLNATGQRLDHQLTFNTASPSGFGNLKVIQYLDQDITPPQYNTDLLVPKGTVAANNLLLFTINTNYLVGFGMGGPYVASAMQNATFLGWAASDWRSPSGSFGPDTKALYSTIPAGTQTYSLTGVLDTGGAVPLNTIFDPRFNQNIYATSLSGNDIGTAMAWQLTSTATSASLTPFIQGVPTEAGQPVIVTDIPTLAVGQAYTTTLSAQFGTPFTTGAPYRWSVASGALPPGLTLNGNTGVITGTPTTAGTYNFTLNAKDAVNKVGTRAYTVAVNEAVKSLQFVQQPSNATAGTAIAPAITVQTYDKLGAALNVAGNPIVMSLYSGTGTLLGTVTQLTNASGLATFNDLNIKIAGVKSIKASSGTAASTIFKVSNPFTITAAAASQLVYTQQPTNTVTNATINQASGGVKVQLQDQYGNAVATAGTAITMSLNSGTGPMNGTLTQNTDATGVAAFNDLSFNTGLSGFKKVQVTGTSLGTTVSAQFAISGPATGFVISIIDPKTGLPTTLLKVNQYSPLYTINITAVDSNGIPTILPAGATPPTISVTNKGGLGIWVWGLGSFSTATGKFSTPGAFSATANGWTTNFVVRTAGAATLKVSQLFNHPGLGLVNATGLLNFSAM